MASKLIRIPVAGGIVTHKGVVQEVVIREPTFREYLDIGEVYEFIVYPNGMRIPAVNSETVNQYIKACLVEPSDPLLIEQGGMPLAKALKGAVLGFFQDETAPKGDASGTSASTSSGDAAKDASPSAT